MLNTEYTCSVVGSQGVERTYVCTFSQVKGGEAEMTRIPIEIQYDIVCETENGARIEKHCMVRIDPDTLETEHRLDTPPPEWARLDVKQCDNCPLSRKDSEYCPAALSFVDIAAEFGEILSYTAANATVTTKERTVSARTTIQKALSSLVGLRMATCGCPVLAKLRPMARFHLPFATLAETVYRSASAYLLAQYFLRRRGKKADLDLAGLRRLYDDIHEVNVSLSERVRSAPSGDAHLNALVILDLFTVAMPNSIDDNLAGIEQLFASYFEDA